MATPAPYAPKKRHRATGKSNSRNQARLGSLVAAAGVIWAVEQGTKGLVALWQFQVLRPGPLEVCALGLLIWLHAKWRRAVEAR